MKVEIGSYEAITRLPELLRMVEQGKSFTLTNRGKIVADLIPRAGTKSKDSKGAVEKLKTFMHANPVHGVKIGKLLDEGRA